MKASDRTATELRALADLPDTSDIPEREDWTGATRGRFHQPATAEKAAANKTDSRAKAPHKHRPSPAKGRRATR